MVRENNLEERHIWYIFVVITNIFIQGKTIQTELFYHGALY